ncbi:TetR/AcrR family transcriptional regulator [Nocardia cyriacigeorgica]|nr:TetR/AcrR family transcriptional regulator [Nocardia cyriacigeorgica]
MTPSTKRGDATRRALLRAARDEFAEYGLAGARVDRIAEAAGVNKERIYGLFGSKDKLFDVILIDSLREFMDTVQPLADTEVGDYVAKLFDYHRDNPKLLRLMLWEALHRGADAHDIDGWRADFYERKFDRAQQQFGVDEQRAGLLLIALCGVANWANTLPQTARLLLGDAADDTATIRAFMANFARAALRYDPSSPVNVLTAPGTAGSASDEPTQLAPGTDASGTDPVDTAAARLRAAQAAVDAARAELATALRAAHASGTSANQLARQVSGTLSRPVVLKLLAD